MAEIYFADIRCIAPEACATAQRLSRVFPERARYVERFKLEGDRLRSLASSLLLYEILGNVSLRYGEQGKPYLSDGPHFNLSHSGNYAVLAVDAHPVGIDLEQHSERDFSAIARFAFHPEEQKMFAHNPCARIFFDIWTLKESYLKMSGVGLSGKPASFAVSIENDDAYISSAPAARLHLYDFDGYSLAFCSEHAPYPKKILSLFD